MRQPILFLLMVLVTGTASCTGYVQTADYKLSQTVAEDARPTPIKFKAAELLLPVGADIGFESDGSRFCGWPRHPVGRSALRDAMDGKFLQQTFHDALEAQGYDVVGGLHLAYDLEDEEDRADYSVTAKIRDIQLDICHREPENFMIFFTTPHGTEGEFYMDVDWTVYDALHRSVIYKTSTQGYTKRRTPNQEGLMLMFSDAFEMAAHNLGTDQPFFDLVVNGVKPQEEKGGSLAALKEESRPSRFDPLEKVALQQTSFSTEPFTKNIDHKRKVAVLVQKFGHGSGFFITQQGHILTNAHLVGDGLRTRIVTANKEKSLVAEVLRVDRSRDVALLRLEDMPEDLEIVTLPLRTGWPDVGEDVYALGAPKDYRILQDTVTKGIVSAHRRDMRFEGVRQNFIQADVEIHKGSDGGALIDKNGNIVAMAVGSKTAPEDIAIGLNYFIPIEEVLEALDIRIGSKARD